MLPSAQTAVPELLLFLVVGLVHTIFPVRMSWYWNRFINFWMPWLGRVRGGFTYGPGGMRAFGIIFSCFSVGMLALYLWQLWHQLPQ
jgi:hypothetical protein